MVYFDNGESDNVLENEISKTKLTGYATIDRPWLKSYTEDEIAIELPVVSAYSYLYRNNVATPNKVALNYDDEKITYKKLFEKIDEVGKALKQSGVKEDDVITLSMPNNLEFVYLFYAISKIGCTIHLIDSEMDIKEIEKYIKAVNSSMTFIMDKDYEKFKPIIENNTINKSVVISHKVKYVSDLFKKYKVDYNDKIINWKNFISEGKKYDSVNAKLEYRENRPFLIIHTLGTSGEKKTVVLTNENINAAVLQSSTSGINIEKNEKWLNTLPNYRTTGITMGIHLPLSNGIETILMPECDDYRFEQSIIKNKPNHIIGTYRCYRNILNSYKLSKKNFSFLKAPIAINDVYTGFEEKINKFLKEHNCSRRVLKGYGMTETSGEIVGTPHNNNKIGSVGIPFTKTLIGIFDPKTNKELKYGQDGEICVSGPTIMNKYLDNQELTNKVIKKHEDGRIWFHTGDLGYMDENGNLYVSYRLDDWEEKKNTGAELQKIIGNYWNVTDCKVITNRDIKHRQIYEVNIKFNDRILSNNLETVALRIIQDSCKEKFADQYNSITFKLIGIKEKEEKEKVKTL